MLIFRLRLPLLALMLFSFCQNLRAQDGMIDTIEVNMMPDSATKSAKEARPTLNLSALRKAAREDSIRIANMVEKKNKDENAEMELLKQKRLKEKELKLQKQKELAEKRKQEKIEREKEYAAKKVKKEKEEKKAKADKKQKKYDKKLAKALAIEKQKKKELSEKQKVTKATKENKAKDTLTKKEAKATKKESKKRAKLANAKAREKAEQTAKAKLELAGEKNLGTKELDDTRTNKSLVDKVEEPISTSTKTKTKNAPVIPIPEGVEQKDNVYGTVRIAYDEQAASFLLSIPTETKMHYHNDHSEQILLIEGQGMVLMGYKTITLKKNELIFITKGTPHKIINNGKGKLKVLSIQAPFYDGRDKIILE